jgi:pyruvate/2-oxoacid:ferredoxin oxidoreductase alpha subunit/NAD-dependent dihydropyrimidine dehydrogenase PreA subunit
LPGWALPRLLATLLHASGDVETRMAALADRPRPVLEPEYRKGCGRCIGACARQCITRGSEIDPRSGLVPVVLHLERCSGCGLCFDACPEPYGLIPQALHRREELLPPAEPPPPASVHDHLRTRPSLGPLVVKGTCASAIGALLAGCRHFFGYPITPSTEGAELMATLLPGLDGSFLQAGSEVATVNHIYGCAAAGLRSMTFTSSPGFSLMLEGRSYMIGAELPGVFVDVMRAGPGLGNIAPEQSDIKLACRGLGHGNTHAVVLAPATTQEMLDLTMLAFDLSFEYRSPVIVLCDGYLGQMTGRVELPRLMIRAGLFRPLTLWPFPVRLLEPILEHVKSLVVIEASDGQLEDEMRLALSQASHTGTLLITSLRHHGGVLPSPDEIVARVLREAGEV